MQVLERLFPTPSSFFLFARPLAAFPAGRKTRILRGDFTGDAAASRSQIKSGPEALRL